MICHARDASILYCPSGEDQRLDTRSAVRLSDQCVCACVDFFFKSTKIATGALTYRPVLTSPVSLATPPTTSLPHTHPQSSGKQTLSVNGKLLQTPKQRIQPTHDAIFTAVTARERGSPCMRPGYTRNFSSSFSDRRECESYKIR